MKPLGIVLAMPLEHAGNIHSCRDYPTMQSHQIFKYGSRRNTVEFVGTPFGWLDEFHPDTDIGLSQIFLDQGKSVSDYENLLVCGVNSMKRFSAAAIARLRSQIKKSIFQIDDSNFNEGRDFVTLAHYIKKSHPSDHSINLGLAVDTDTFVLGKKNLSGEFFIHVDHRWTKTHRLDGFDVIKSVIANIRSVIKNSDRWHDIRVIYHTDEITDIARIGTYDPGNTSIDQLASIYSKTHLAFVSHAETLGQYPLEMLSSGASVAMHRKFIPKETRNLYQFCDIAQFEPKTFLRELNADIFVANRAQAQKFSYDGWVDKMLDQIIK